MSGSYLPDTFLPMRQTLAVVVPAHNEADGLPALHQRLVAVLDRLDLDSRVIYVDDGSRDATWACIADLVGADSRVCGLRLSRNFGKELAMTAGLDAVDADAAVVIDADLQDPPELIEELVARWRDGHDVVYARRMEREGESWVKRATAAGFYRLMGRLSKVPIPPDTGDFRLLSRPALDALRRLRERHRFMKGLFAWVGFRQVAVPYRRERRHAGKSKFNYWRLWNFALEGITSFSTAPLRVATYAGVAVASVAFLTGLWIVLKTLLWGDAVPGYPSLMVTVLFIGGVQLTALGIIGEYLGRLYDESKQRPLYLVAQQVGTVPEPVRPDPMLHAGRGGLSSG
jgi:polyisoprenyl-phosphate glycosyltransferase